MISTQVFIKRFITVTSLSVLMISASLMGCQSNGKATKTTSNTGFVQCKTPRPEVCTKEYRPVCASKDTGIRCITTPCPSEEKVTYPNACSACADSKVHGYTPNGACN